MKILFFLSLLTLLICQPVFANEKKAQDFALKDIYGKTVRLSDSKGKVVLLHFWAMWCGDCVKEMPSLNSLYASYREKGLDVISVSTDLSVSKLQTFANKHNIGFVILHDHDKSVTIKSYNVIGLPATFFIDRNGFIIERINGPRDWNSQMMKKKVQAVLKRQQ